MNLTQINLLWEEYKEKYDIDSSAKITAVKYDTDRYVEGCFNLLELMEGEYVLHLNPNVHLYAESYVKFILFHEFTHFYDFMHCPYKEKLPMIMWMNAYSEYHACRVTLARFIETLTLSMVHMDKVQLPGPYREISIRRLLIESVYRTKLHFDAFFTDYELSDFVGGFRNLMYLFGYLSLFKNDETMVEETLTALHINDTYFRSLYQALKDMDADQIISLYQSITDKATLTYLKAMFRRFYPPQILSDDEIQGITLDNYRDYADRLDRKIRESGLASSAQEACAALQAQVALAQLYFYI